LVFPCQVALGSETRFSLRSYFFALSHSFFSFALASAKKRWRPPLVVIPLEAFSFYWQLIIYK
jgi:hypothetical protein